MSSQLMEKNTLFTPHEVHTVDPLSVAPPKSPPLATHKQPDETQTKALQERYEASVQTLRLLERMFPNCFNQKGPRPLKRHIEQDLFAIDEIMLTTSRAILRNALTMYAHQSAYYKAVLADDWRYDLAGQPVEKIELKHKAYAKETLEKRRQRRKAGRKQPYRKD
jgi:ProP effector